MTSEYISAFLALSTIIGTAFVMRYMLNQHEKKFETNEKIHAKIFARLDAHGDEIISNKTTLKNTVTMKEVAEEFVRKEVFLQSQKHLEEKVGDVKHEVKNVYVLLREVADTVKKES